MRFLIALLLIFSSSAFAQLNAPEDGIWGDPAAQGSGFVIELQDNQMAVSAFTYTSAGASTWLLATGAFNSQTGRFVGTLVSLANGQCLGCPYRAPGPGGTSASIEIRFTSMVTGQVFIDGQLAYNIRHSYYAYPTPDDFILGGWSAAYYSIGGGLSGHALRMERKITLPNGTPGVEGRIDTETRPAVGQFVASEGKYLILVDSSTSFYVAYVFDNKKDFWFGKGYLFRKTEQITDAVPKDHYAARILTGAALRTISKRDAETAMRTREERHWQEIMAAKGLREEVRVEPEIAEAAAQLVEMLEAFGR